MLGHYLALGGELTHKGLQPSLRGPVMSVDGCERRPDLLYVRLDDRRDDFVFGLEVVVDVAGRDVRRLSDIGERGLFNALLVQELGGGGYQPLPFPRPLPDRGRRA